MDRPVDEGRRAMRLGVNLGYFSTSDEIADGIELAVAAERLDYDCVWVAEAYGTDAPSVLGAIAARTSTIGLGSAVMQIPARSPAMTAMTAATLDALSAGRFRLGLGVSGPQVSEGWHGVRYDDPVGRTEEYVAIVRRAFGRGRLTFGGRHHQLPLPDGPGKALALAMTPLRDEIPIYLAAVGPRNLALAGRIANGWLGILLDPQSPSGAGRIAALSESLRAAGRDPGDFDINVQVTTAIGADPEAAANALRPAAALYVGGMGSRETNFYHRIACELGFRAEADLVQDLFLSRRYDDAAAAVPLEFLLRTSLAGDRQHIAAGLRRYADAGITTLSIAPAGDSLASRITILEAVQDARADAALS